MGNNDITGNALEIPEGLLKNLEEIDNKINKIATDSSNMGKLFSSSMGTMTTGSNALLEKLQSIKGIVGSLGTINTSGVDNISKGMKKSATEAEKAASNITKVAVAINKMNNKTYNPNSSILAWQGLQKNVEIVSKRQEALTRITKDYEKILSNIKEGKGGVITRENREQYQSAIKELEANRLLISSYREKQQAIIAYQQEQRRQIDNEEQLKKLAISDGAIGGRKKDEELKKLNDHFRQLEKEWNERTKRNKKRAEEEARAEEKKAERVSRANDKEAKSREKLRQAEERRINTKAIDAYNRAMASSEATISQRINKLARLKQAEEMLVKTNKNYTNELKRIKEETERLNTLNKTQADSFEKVRKSQSHLMDTSGQLARKLALVFSVSQIQGYIMNVVRVTGEFEKQNVALASILQNKDKADKLFNQITELAVKSPFQLKELVTYTKSLSAYQVEYEKLFDTTKRLADVSAGLGVDMQRLILAFGQVKAANFLRGTEVRQFTEAGLNILGELAKYYGELENRMVSVGEVQEMVTKRMVSFGDVEEVFKRVTSAGGIFYEMQERQAETLAGQISNLYDSIDIMLNDIGSANNGTIKDMIALVRNLLQNWRDLAFSFKVVAAELSPFIAYMVLAKTSSTKLGLAISSLGKNLLISAGIIKGTSTAMSLADIKAKLLTLSIKALKTALKGIATLGVGLAIGAIVVAIEKLIVEGTRASRMAAELKEKLDNLFNEGDYNAAKLSNGFRQLAEKILDSNTSVDEQNEALKELKRTYGEILPSQNLTTEGLKAMKGNYDEVTKAIYAKIEAQVKEKQIAAVSETYGRDVEQSFDKVKDMLVKEQGLLPQDATKVVTKLRQALEDGTLKIGQDYTAFVENIIKESYHMNSKIRTAFKEMAVTTSGGATTFLKVKDVSLQNEAIDKFAFSVFKLKEQIDNINGVKIFPFSGSSDYDALEKEMEKVKAVISKARKEVAEDNKGKSPFFINEAQNKKEKEIIQDWVNTFKKGVIEIKDAYGNTVNPKSSTSLKFIEDIQKQLDSVDGNKMQKEVRSVIRSFAKLNDVSLVDINKVLMQSSQTMGDYRKQVEGDIKSIEERLKQYNKGYSGFITQIFNDDDKDKAKQTLDLLKAIQLALFPHIPKKSEENKELKKLKEQIALIKKAGQEYKKLQKYYSDDKAKQKVQDSFKDAFKEVGLSIDMDFDTQGIIDGIEHISNNAGEEGRKAIKEATSDLKAEVDIEFRQDKIRAMKSEIEDLFSSYEISMEIDKAGLDKDVVSNMFHIDVMSLGDLKGKLNKMRDMYVNQGDELRKVWEDAMKKISEIEDRELKSRLERFSDYLSDYLDKIESVKAKAALDIHYADTIFNSNGVDAEQYTQIIKNIVDSTNEEISKLNTEKFKESPEYIKAMGDLSAYSAKELEQMLQKMKELVASSSNAVSASDLKVYQDVITKITGQLKKVKMPWEKNEIADFKEMNRLQKEYEDEIENQNRLLEEQKMKLNELKEAKANLAAMQQQKQEEGDSFVVNRQIEQQQGYIQNLTKDLGGIQNKLNLSQSNISNISGKMGGMAGGAGKALAQVDKIVKLVYNSINSTIELFNEFKSLADSFGKDTTKGKWGMWSEGMKAMGEMNNKVMGSWESFKKGDMMGASVKAVGAVFSVIKGINAIGDKKKENQIQKHIERVEDLTYAYEKLKEATERAYDVNELRKGTEQMNNNLAARNKALQASIKAEEDKKKTDRERIKEWQKEIDANNKMILENKKQLLAELGGFGTDDAVKNAAQQFSDSWLNSFLEVNDGMQGLKENMDEWMKNAISKQLLTQLSKKFITPVIESFDNLFKENSDEGAKLTGEEAKAWQDLYKKKSEEFNEAAQQYIEMLKQAGVEIGGSKEEGDKLSGLSRSIAGITESQADALSAITESIRFFTSDSNMQLKQIANALTNPEFESPMISELRLQTEQLRLMYSLINSTTKTKAGQSGHIFKVEIV